MAEQWQTVAADKVQVGDRIRFFGTELTVSKIEQGFMGMPMIAFIEDTPEKWFKAPCQETGEVEVLKEA